MNGCSFSAILVNDSPMTTQHLCYGQFLPHCLLTLEHRDRVSDVYPALINNNLNINLKI